MKKSEEESLIRKTARATANSFKKILLSPAVDKAVEETLEETKKKIDQSTKIVMARTLSFSLVISGIIMAFIGLYFFLVENTVLPKSAAMMIVSVLLLCLGWFTLNTKKN